MPVAVGNWVLAMPVTSNGANVYDGPATVKVGAAAPASSWIVCAWVVAISPAVALLAVTDRVVPASTAPPCRLKPLLTSACVNVTERPLHFVHSTASGG